MFHRVSMLPFVLLATMAQSPNDSSLCEGSAFVTGTRAETRTAGLARALRDVLLKRSGDPALMQDRRVEPLEANAADLVADYLYLDRMSDQPKHDEQGTRDRPYTLIAHFDCKKVDAALNALGDRPWLTPRPTLVPRVLVIDKQHARFPLSADGDPDERHRQALLAAANRYGMRIALMPLDKTDSGITVPDALVVTGTLRWSDTDPGWAAAWHARDADWGIKGVSFDEAYRDMVQGAMAIASGHRPPPGP